MSTTSDAYRGSVASAFCDDCDDEWDGPGALAAAKRHHDRTGHETAGQRVRIYRYDS